MDSWGPHATPLPPRDALLCVEISTQQNFLESWTLRHTGVDREVGKSRGHPASAVSYQRPQGKDGGGEVMRARLTNETGKETSASLVTARLWLNENS